MSRTIEVSNFSNNNLENYIRYTPEFIEDFEPIQESD